MNFAETKKNYETIALLLSNKAGIELTGDFDSDKSQIKKIADECLEAKNGNYPTLYYFAHVDGTGYILFDYNGNQFIDEVVGGLDSEKDCQPTVCKQYVLQNSCFWNLDGIPYYPAVMGIYGMTDCVEELFADEKDVVVWCERKWHQDYADMPLNEYCCHDDGEVILFDTVTDAKAYIDSLMAQSYVLQPHELRRPNYIVSY